MAPWWSKETACFCGHPRFNFVCFGFYTKEWRNPLNNGNNPRQRQDTDNNKVREQTRDGHNENTTKEADATGSWTLTEKSDRARAHGQ